ncbi:cd36 family protein [Stylonychia lemnae]|uniref:Cd36 family protein n=1 Tax=Stylonychia lemnae TaxID=5949 RepID=A0A078B1Q6_STYLE|nr:cd36 family protein [Stylonychia lemnae]|eukprot:CDW87257.1 cd36 family protein [Stylonychia lemnae]
MKRSSKFKCCGIASIVIGLILIGVGIGWPFIIDSLVKSQSKDQAALGKDNMDKWKDIPGKYDIQLNRKTYLYNAINREDVIFKGEVPTVEEYGPFIYREYDNYSTPEKWDEKITVPGKDKTKNAIRMTFNQYAQYNFGGDYGKAQDQDIDKKIWQINQAALGVWFAANHPPAWRLGLNLLYSVVLDGLGRQVLDQGSWTFLNKVVGNQDGIQSNLFNDKITPEQAKQILTDPDFGLNNVNNYIRWAPMTDGSDPLQFQLMVSELKARFGLTYEAIQSAIPKWNGLILFGKGYVISQSSVNNENNQGIAYVQWANSMVTGNLSKPISFDSVTQQTDTVTGYPEISFFQVNKLYPNLKQDKLYQRFKDVKLFVGFSAKDKPLNYEYLFQLIDDQGNEPPSKSLFNMDTIKALYNVPFVDILDEKKPQPEDIDLTGYQDVATLLGLSVEQTYLIRLWLEYVKQTTFQRSQATTEIAIISQLTSQQMQQTISTMEQEVPLIVYTEQLASIVDVQKVGCLKFYSDEFKFSTDLQQNLCSGGKLGIKTFDFSDVRVTSKAWMSILLHNNTLDASDYADLLFLSSMSTDDLNNLLFLSTSTIQTYLTKNVFGPVYAKHKDTVCTVSQFQMCTPKELAYQQWLDLSILSQPDATTPESYVNQFPADTKLKLAPELGYFLYKAGLDKVSITLGNVVTFMQLNRLYNLEIIGDILLNVKSDYIDVFTNEQIRRYIRYIMVEGALGGLFQYRTPREYLEGFIDPTVYQTAQLPVWNGGDQTNDPFMSINYSPTSPKDNPIVFFSGTDDYLYTRSFGLWLDLPYITMKRKDYTSLFNLEAVYADPWIQADGTGGKEYLEGTDGFQFHPDLQSDDRLWVWVNDLGRNGYFDYYSDDTDAYDGLKMMTYQISPDLMKKANKDNKKFGTFLDGTSPMFTILQAPVLASKGHFYQIDTIAADSVAQIVTKGDRKPILPIQSEDDTFLGMEQHSGVNVQARQRLQLNFYIAKDNLFNYIKPDSFIITPLTYVKRESIMTKSQVKDILGDLYVARTARTAGLATLLSIGVILLGLSIFMFCRFRKVKKEEEYGIFDTKKNQKQINQSSDGTLLGGDSITKS